MREWKDSLLLLSGIGVSNIGAWIFLIALNLIVLDELGSPLAVVILYVLKPMATLFTNTWSGSMIDRVNKRNLMVVLDIFRALLIATLPFITSIWLMYTVVFIINMGSAMFYPASMTYITKLIPKENRQQFNALRSVMDSGAFLIGPGIAGLLFMIGTPTFALYINALALFLSGMITLFLPNLEESSLAQSKGAKLSLHLIKEDWRGVWSFSRRNTYVMMICLLFSCMIVMTAAIDSLEAAFSKEVLYLSNSTYGILVSIAGGGFVLGAFVNAAFGKRLTPALLMGGGSLIVSAGYLVYSFSAGFISAGLGFFVLSFALAFANTGFQTFYQNNIPVDMMGRIGSMYGLIEAVLVIVATILIGIAAHLSSIREVVIAGSIVMLLVTLVLSVYSRRPGKSGYFRIGKTG
jgi:MFS family permease